jgi:hypothetical protein
LKSLTMANFYKPDQSSITHELTWCLRKLETR